MIPVNNYLFYCLLTILLSCTNKVSFGSLIEPKAENNVTSKELIAEGKEYAIATDSELASRAGSTMFNQNGTIVDAAMAASFVLCVTRPQSTGIAGGGFLVLHFNNKDYAFDFRERAPLKTKEDMFLDAKSQETKASLIGYRSIATPGFIAGMLQIHKKFGRLPLQVVLQPAIEAAQDGFIVYPNLEEAIIKEMERMSPEMRQVFAPNNIALKTGTRFKQPALANLLISLQRLKHDDAIDLFYKGDIAKDIVEDIKKNQGILTLKDLEQYEVKVSKPIYTSYQKYKLATMPLPSSGSYMFEMLKNMEQQPYKDICSKQDVSYKQICKKILIDSMGVGFKHRAESGGDPSFAKTNTTHISLMDKYGNALSSTQSINYIFGSHRINTKWGFVYNDTMDDFTTNLKSGNIYGLVGSSANTMAPLKTPLSSMSPTIIFKNKTAVGAVGGMGGPFIISGIFQTIVNSLTLELDPYSSVALERLHYQYKPSTIYYENNYLSKEIQDTSIFPNIEKFAKNHPAKVFYVQKKKNIFYAVSDPRGDGKPVAK